MILSLVVFHYVYTTVHNGLWFPDTFKNDAYLPGGKILAATVADQPTVRL